MADGTEKPIEDVKPGDLVRAWDFEVGAFVDAEILWNIHANEEMQNALVIDAVFSDGTTVSVADEHGFFDLTLSRYVAIDQDAARYIGHEFIKQDGNGWKTVALVSLAMRRETVAAYAPIAKKTVNCLANGLLSVANYCHLLCSYFDVDAATLKYINVEEDISKYGLLSYEQLSHLLSKSFFDAINAKYFSVLFGKGRFDPQTFEALIAQYSDQVEYLNRA